MSESHYHSYLEEHREPLYDLATKKTKKGKVIIKQRYNSEQLKYLVTFVFKDTPEGYGFNGENFVKLNE